MSLHFAGIDIGSRTVKAVVINENREIVVNLQSDTGFDPINEAKNIISSLTYDNIMATGYGRNLFKISFNTSTVTEIKAHAKGSRFFFPDALNILDIGGQDSKTIALFNNGKVKKFEMNDRCAAGTGKFLEIMAKTLGYNIEEFGLNALKAKNNLNISSMCTVFAESEVTSLIAKGENRQEIARALHNSIIPRVVSMIKRILYDGDIVFTGGVAKNPCISYMLQKKLNCHIIIPEDPQMIGALGAALLIAEMKNKK